jgi:hypothetical protein
MRTFMVRAATLAASLVLVLPSSPAGAGTGLTRDVRSAYRHMGCRYGSVIYSHGGGEPRFIGETCFVPHRGNFEIDHYYRTKAGRHYMLDYFLCGSTTSWVTVKRHLIITNSKFSGRAYDETLARWAARRIGGRAVHGHRC